MIKEGGENLIAISYIFIAVALIVIWAIYRTTVLLKTTEKNILREVVINIFFIYFLVLIELTICKRGTLEIGFQNKFYVNYIPFRETINMFKDNFMGIGNALYNVVGNILLFVPLGFFIPLLFSKKNKISSVALYGACTSILIEAIQLITSNNLTDIDDVIFNTLGAILGFFTYNLLNKTKLRELMKKVRSEFSGNLIVLGIKPIGSMLLLMLVCIIIAVYNSTIPASASNEEIANTVFKYSSNKDFQAVKDISGEKLFLKDEDNYVNLISVKSVLNKRWVDSRNSIGQYEKVKGDYDVVTIYNNDIDNENETSMSIVAFGKNKNANKIEIIFNGTSYVEEIKNDEYFIVNFPSFETVKNNDMENIHNGEESEILKIKFIDSEGNECNDMKFASNSKLLG